MRVLVYVCGDHQWYNNHTARYIVDNFAERFRADPRQDPILIGRVRELSQRLSIRANGNASFAEGIRHLPFDPQNDQEGRNAAGHDHKSQLIGQTIERLLNLIHDETLPVADRIKAICLIARRHALIGSGQENEFFRQAIAAVDLAVVGKSELFGCIVQAQALINPALAMPTANLIQDAYLKAEALLEIAKSLALTSPEQARRLFQETVEMANLCEHPITRSDILKKTAQTQAITHLGEANSTFQLAVDAAELSTDAFEGAKALVSIAKAQAMTDPASANKWLDRAIKWSNSAIVLRETRKRVESTAMKEIALMALQTNPERTLGLVVHITNVQDKVEVLLAIAKFHASTENERSEEMIDRAKGVANQIEAAQEKDKALYKIAKAQALINPEQALETVNSIQHQGTKDRALHKIAMAYATINPEQALNAADSIRKKKQYRFIRLYQAQL